MKFKNDFPLLKSCTYFNTAYVGLMSESLYNFRVNFERGYLHNGDEYKLNAYDNLPQTQALIASFIGSKKEQTYFVSNFSTGIRYVMNLLPENANVLFIKEDYHSLVSSIKEKKFKLFPIEMSDNVEIDIAYALEPPNEEDDKKLVNELVLPPEKIDFCLTENQEIKEIVELNEHL